MSLKKSLFAVSVAGLAAVAGPAQANIFFTFDPAGMSGLGPDTILASFIDQLPGNTNAINGVNTVTGGGAPLPVGTIVQDYYQSNLNTVVSSAGPASSYLNGSNGSYFTFVATFTEEVVANNYTPGVTSGTDFSILSGTFKMCVNTTGAGNDLTGLGFACAGDGILSGRITGGTATLTAFLNRSLQDLDKSPNGDQWTTTDTIVTNGSADITAELEYVNTAYFPDLQSLAPFITLALTNSSLITPYNQTDPSQHFSTNTVSDGDYVTNVGAVNGIDGPNFLFQSDANTAFNRVPEPSSLALLGVALAGLGLARRRRT